MVTSPPLLREDPAILPKLDQAILSLLLRPSQSSALWLNLSRDTKPLQDKFPHQDSRLHPEVTTVRITMAAEVPTSSAVHTTEQAYKRKI